MRILRSALAVIILFSSFAAVSESAKSLYKKGVDADARQDYEAAYEYYKAAYLTSALAFWRRPQRSIGRRSCVMQVSCRKPWTCSSKPRRSIPAMTWRSKRYAGRSR